MFHPHMSPRAIDRAGEVLRTPMIGQGDIVDEFEEAIRRQLGLAHVAAVNSSSSAIRLALDIAGVRPGDEVITTPVTCTLTNHAILEQFATPVFADIQPDTGNIDPADVERRVTPRTKAIVCTHWGGTPCDLDELNQTASKHGLDVIEDASEAFGAVYRERSVGLHSRFVAFSFHAAQIVTTVEGGALAVQTAGDNRLIRAKRWYGIDRAARTPNVIGYYDFDVSSVGYGYHMTNLAAAVGIENLKTLPSQRDHRSRLAEIYWRGLENVSGLTLARRHLDRIPAYHFFTVMVERKTDFARWLRQAGIGVSIVHERNDAYTVFGGRRDDLPNVDGFSESYIGLPLHMGMCEEDAAYVVETVRKGW